MDKFSYSEMECVENNFDIYHARQNGWMDPKRNYHHTDLGNAKRIVDRHGINLRYVVEKDSWLIWHNERWNVDNSFHINRLAKETVEAM